MAQYIYTMNGVGKVVPANKEILKDICLNFFPGAKIGVSGYNGAGKSTLLRIMAGDKATNHLDAESIAWLEHFLHEYPDSVVAVTHYFLFVNLD